MASTYLRVSQFYPEVRERTGVALQELITLTRESQFEKLLVLEQYALLQSYCKKTEKALEIAKANKDLFEEISRSERIDKSFINFLSARNFRFLGEIYAKQGSYAEAE